MADDTCNRYNSANLKMKTTGLNYLLPGVFLTKCNFSSYTNFKKRFRDEFSRLPFDREQVIKKITEIIDDYSRKEPVTKEKAERLLIAEDLKKVKNTLMEADIPNPEAMLKEHYEKIKEIIKKYNIINKFPDYYIVDSFPKPFENMEWICSFFEDEEKEIYGIEPGIYFKKEYLECYSASKNLLHELTHIAVSQNSSEKDKKAIARGLEDGICDVFGSLFLFSELTNPELAKNIMEYTRFGFNDSQLSAVYRDNVRMAFLLYKKYGINGLVDIIKSGRGNLKEIEKSCLVGNYSFDIKDGNWNNEFDKLADYFLGFQRNLVVSPLAYYSALRLKEKDSIEDFIRNNNLDISAKEALNELQEKVFLIALNNGKIEYDASKLYLNGALRYENS